MPKIVRISWNTIRIGYLNIPLCPLAKLVVFIGTSVASAFCNCLLNVLFSYCNRSVGRGKNWRKKKFNLKLIWGQCKTTYQRWLINHLLNVNDWHKTDNR
jgi:hypothetical protein